MERTARHLIALALVATTAPASAGDTSIITVPRQYEALAECLYDAYRSPPGVFHHTDPTQVRMTPRVASRRVELEYTLASGGAAVPMWRAMISPVSKASAQIEFTVFRGSAFGDELAEMLARCR